LSPTRAAPEITYGAKITGQLQNVKVFISVVEVTIPINLQAGPFALLPTGTVKLPLLSASSLNGNDHTRVKQDAEVVVMEAEVKEPQESSKSESTLSKDGNRIPTSSLVACASATFALMLFVGVIALRVCRSKDEGKDVEIAVSPHDETNL